MGTMTMGYYYDQGKKIGYDISTPNLTLWNVAYKDKKRIIEEFKNNGWSEDEIKIERVEIS